MADKAAWGSVQNGRLVNLFFANGFKTKDFTNEHSGTYFQDRETPRSAHIWLSKLFLQEKEYKLRLIVKNYPDTQHKLSLAVEVEVKEEALIGAKAAGGRDESRGSNSSGSRADIAAAQGADGKRQKEKKKTLVEQALFDDKEFETREKKNEEHCAKFPLGAFLNSDLVAMGLKLEAVASLNLLSEYIHGFQHAIERLSEKGGMKALNKTPASSQDELALAEAVNSAAQKSDDMMEFAVGDFSRVFVNVFPLVEFLWNFGCVLGSILFQIGFGS